MPIDIGKRQTIEEITNGRIKKQSREEAERPAGRRGGATQQMAERRGGRTRK